MDTDNKKYRIFNFRLDASTMRKLETMAKHDYSSRGRLVRALIERAYQVYEAEQAAKKAG